MHTKCANWNDLNNTSVSNLVQKKTYTLQNPDKSKHSSLKSGAKSEQVHFEG